MWELLHHHLWNSHNTAGTSSTTIPREEPKFYYPNHDKESRVPGTTRHLGDDRQKRERSSPPLNDHLLDETPRNTPRERSPVRAPLPYLYPPKPKMVIHAQGRRGR